MIRRLAATLLFLAAGCALRDNLPHFPRTDSATTLQALAQRASTLHTVSASGSMELQRANSDGVRLDLAVVLQPPDHARLRTWKFGQAVFDLTLTPAGLWLEAPRSGAHAQEINTAGLDAARIARAASLITGQYFAQPKLSAELSGSQMLVRSAEGASETIICTVDRDTLTASRYEFLDQSQQPRFALMLSRYKIVSGIPLPQHIVAASETGTITIDLDEIDVNTDLPPAAFTPPRRAEKLP